MSDSIFTWSKRPRARTIADPGTLPAEVLVPSAILLVLGLALSGPLLGGIEAWQARRLPVVPRQRPA